MFKFFLKTILVFWKVFHFKLRSADIINTMKWKNIIYTDYYTITNKIEIHDYYNQTKLSVPLNCRNELIIWILNPFQDGNNELIIAKLNPLVIPIIWLMGFMFKKSIQYWFLKWLTSVFK